MGDSQGDSVATAPVTIGGLYRFFDDHRREWIEIPVAVDMAAAIARLDAGMLRREKLHRKRTVSFTGADFNGDLIASGKPARDRAPAEARYPGRPWEGPAFTFTLLIGVGTPWPGPASDGPCPCCAGGELPEIAVCLFCARTGRDAEIRRASPRELAALRERVPRRDGMQGGRGKARPRTAAAKGG